MSITQFKFIVLGKNWTLRLMKRKKYAKKNGSDSLAMTYIHKRRIDLSPKGVDLETLIHELVHAFITECCTRSTDMSVDDMEEVFCDLMAKHGSVILLTADSLMEQISKANQEPACSS